MSSLKCLLLFLLAFPGNSHAWWSVELFGYKGFDTHRKITNAVTTKHEDDSEYADIKKFASVIIEGSSTQGNDEIAHGKLLAGDTNYPLADSAARFDGGPYELWHKRGLKRYKDGQFIGGTDSAYYYFALMAHLVEDHAVPAHAANIYHAQLLGDSAILSELNDLGVNLNSLSSVALFALLKKIGEIPNDVDDLEARASNYGMEPRIGFDLNNEKDFEKNPIYAYYHKERGGIVPDTQNKLASSDWSNPNYYNNQYWYENVYPDRYKYNGQAFFPNANFESRLGWGTYGGIAGHDMYGDNETAAAFKIAYDQVDAAAAYTDGMLRAVSKSLPPLVQSPKLNGVSGVVATINPGQTNTISFQLQDNRPGVVKYRFVVDKPEGTDGEGDIIDLIGQTENFNDTPPDLTSQEFLPFHTVITKDWNGLYANGEPIPAGEHTLSISGFDEDQNHFDYVIGTFKATSGPSITVTTPLSIPYERFSGISAIVPASINPVIFPSSVSVYMWQGLSPVTKLTIKDPSGAETVVSYPAAEGIKISSINTPLDGRYELTVLDEAGNRTFAPFSLGGINVSADLAQSKMIGYDKLGASLEFDFHDFYPMEKAELYDSSGTLQRTSALSGFSNGETYSLYPLADTENFTRYFLVSPPTVSYVLKLSDEKGHTLEHSFGLTAGFRGFGPLDETIDLSSGTGFLPGVLGRIRPWAPDLGVELDSTTVVTGPLVTTQQIGSYTMSVVTGDTPNLNGITPQTLGTRSYYYSVWNASYTVPHNCVMQWGAEVVSRCQDGTLTKEECDSALLCHNDSLASPLPLRRYIRLKNTVQRDELTGVFKFLCSYKDPETGECSSVYHPRLADLPNLGIEGWGVAYAGGGSVLSGGLAAWVPAGYNVTVKLSDWLELTFEHVTGTGYVRASLGSLPSLPGVLPLRTLRIQAGGTGYSGNIRVAVNYNATGLTDGQLGFMEALKINDAASRDFTRLPVSKAGQTAAFNTRSLGDFMLEVPSYPEPYQYASSGLIGTSPKLEWFAGAPASVTHVAPGSQAEQGLFDILANRGLAAAGDAYVIGPTGQQLDIAAAIKMVYDKSVIAARKFHESSLGIYQVSEDGSYLARLGNMVLNTAKGEISAEVSELHSIFVIAGSTEPAPPAPLSPDVTFPVTNLAFGIPAYESDGQVMISSASPVFVDAYDPEIPHRITSEVSTTYYLVDAAPESCTQEPPLTGPPGTCLNPIYKGPFTLSAGIHTIWYGSDDRAGNKETIKSKILYVDGDAPVVTVSAAGQAVVPGGTAYITTVDSVTLAGIDPALSGPASDVGMTVFDISTTPCTGFMDYPQSPGDCRKILYTGPFSLPVGTHTVYYSAMDNVGNIAGIKSAVIKVVPPVVLTSVTLNASFVFLEIGGSQQFSATGKFSDGTSRALTSADGPLWSVAHDTVAVITPNGLVTGAAYGKTQVRVSLGGLSADAYLFVYEPLPPSFSLTGAMTVPRHTHTATLLPDGNVLVAGGNNGAQILSSAEVYYPNTGKFIATGSMRAPRGRGHTETLLPDGTVLLTGGISGNYVVATAEVYNPTTQTFSQAGSMAAARYSHSATLLADGKVLITGGSGDYATVAQAELYDPSSKTFSAAGSLALARYYHTAVLLPDGKVLVAGGLASPGSGHTATAELYDPVAKTFSPTGPLSMKRAYAKAVLLRTGEALLVGGYSGTSDVLAAETYNQASGSFATAGSLSVGRMVGHTATLLPNGRVLVAGGDVYGNNNPISLAEIYDPATRKFGATVPMNSGRFFHAAALLLPNGRVLVCGGNNAVSSLNTAELYNLGFGVPSTLESITVSPSSATIEVDGTKQFTASGNFSDGSSRPLGAGLTWSVVPATVAVISNNGLATGIGLGKARITVSSGSVSAEAVLTVSPPQPRFIATGAMTVPRHTHTATLLPNGTVLVAGGNNGAQILSSAELYYPDTGKFIATGSMRATRGRGHTETLLPGGNVLLTGGISGNSVVATAEVYNPATGEFSTTGSMAAARYSHNATLLADGKVLITGGSGDYATVAQAELYDPSKGTFSPAGSLALARYYHTATLLPDGKVLVAGGLAGPGTGHTATAEIYDPVKKTFSPTNPLSMKRAYAKAVLLRTGEVLVVGGYSGTSNVLVAETYNPGSGSFSVAGSLGVGRMVGHTASLLPDGRALVAGGDVYGNNNPVSLAEIYDPVTRAFSATAPMSSGRFFHAAALLLPNGKVLVCGGNNASASLTTAELFDSGFRGALSPILTSLLVEPSTASLAAGETRQFTAFGNFSDGSSRVLVAADGLAWSVGHATVAAVGEGGLVTGTAYGKTSVRASSGVYSSEAGLSVFYPPGVSSDGLVSVNVPDAGLSITAVSTDTIVSTAPIFAAMSIAGLKPAMDAFYDFQPSGVQFAVPAKLRFIFDPALVEPAAVAIYYFDGVTWSSASIADQTTGLLAGGQAYVEGYISHSSIYAALYFKDILPPVTGLAFSAPNFGAKPVYISSFTSLRLAAYDDAVTAGDRLGGVAARYYSVDSGAFTLYSGTFSIAGEGSHVVGYYSVDNAGNREEARSAEVSVDVTPAVSAVSLDGTAGRKGWFLSPVAVILASTDSLSGVAGTYYAPDDAPFALYGSSFGITAEGLHSLRHYAVDNIGNREAEKTINFGIDTSTPVITFVRTPGHNTVGWNNTPVSVVFSGTDAVSGIAYCSPAVVLESEGFAQPVSGYCADYAGWSSTAALTLNIDRTGPVITISSPVVGNIFIATKDRIGVFFTAADNLDPSPKASARLLQVEDKGSPRAGRPVVIAVTYGQLIEPLDIDDGIWRLTVSATDFADNTSTLSGGTFEVVHDVLAPRTSKTMVGGVSLTDGATNYITGETVLKFSSADDLVAAEDGIGLGVKKQIIKLKAEGLLVKELAFENPEPRQGVIFNSTFTLAATSGLADGLYSLVYYSEDILGNIEGEKTLLIGLDNTAPVTTAELTGTPGENGWYVSSVSVKLTAGDILSDVAGIYYQTELNGQKSEPRSYTGSFTVSAEGLYNIYFHARDRLGNTEPEKSIAFKIDKTAPVSAYRVEGIVHNRDGKIYLSLASKLSLSAADPVSGGAASDIDVVEYYIDSAPYIVYTSSFSFNEGIRSVYYRSRDKAGNEETGKSVELHIDGTSPVTLFNISGTPYIVDGTHYINSQSVIAFSVTDPLVEGVASEALITKYRLDDGAWQVYAASIAIPAEGLHSLEYYSLDNVQNAEALKTLNIIIDNTAPVSTLNIGEPVFEVFGLNIITPETPVTLDAEDPETAGPASRVKSIYYVLTDASGQGSGIRNYTEPFNTGREGVFTVSYWSVDNVGNSGTPLEAKLRVSSLRSDALDAVDGLEMTGSADIAGTVRSNGTVSLAGNARILGDVYASTISISGKAQLTGQQHSGAATLVPTPLYMPELVEIASNTNNNSLVPAKYLVNGRLVVPAKDELTLSTGVYYFNGIDLGGGAKVGVNGKVDILVTGDISINGGASLNAAGSSSRLNIFLSTGSALTFTGGGSLAAYVYAPYSQLKLAGNALLGGHYFVKRAVISGAGNILQAGEALPVAAAPPGGGPKTKAAAMASGAYSVLAGPDPAFRLGEVYVFPNPAKGGEAPVFHIETGIADSVKITIYTMSGRAAHEQTLTGLPAELDDGNGLSYAYEYVWRGHIPSGVYLYYIETQKAGQKLKKTGKFSVVR